jgi:hypothetical protein
VPAPPVAPAPVAPTPLRPAGSDLARRASSTPRSDRAAFLALDLLLAAEELAGFALSNRPAGASDVAAEAVLVADEYPFGDEALPVSARVEAARRPERMPQELSARVTYREDDGLAERLLALTSLLARHPLRCLADRAGDGPSLLALAPAVRRLERAPRAVVRFQAGAEGLAPRIKSLRGLR